MEENVPSLVTGVAKNNEEKIHRSRCVLFLELKLINILDTSSEEWETLVEIVQQVRISIIPIIEHKENPAED